MFLYWLLLQLPQCVHHQLHLLVRRPQSLRSRRLGPLGHLAHPPNRQPRESGNLADASTRHAAEPVLSLGQQRRMDTAHHEEEPVVTERPLRIRQMALASRRLTSMAPRATAAARLGAVRS